MDQDTDIETLTDQNFAEKVIGVKDQLVVVDFWAIWCGPCHVMEPIFSAVVAAYQKNELIKIGKLDVDAQPETAGKYQIMSIPTTKFFINGEVVDEIMGAVPKDVLVKKIEANLAKVKEA